MIEEAGDRYRVTCTPRAHQSLATGRLVAKSRPIGLEKIESSCCEEGKVKEGSAHVVDLRTLEQSG